MNTCTEATPLFSNLFIVRCRRGRDVPILLSSAALLEAQCWVVQSLSGELVVLAILSSAYLTKLCLRIGFVVMDATTLLVVKLTFAILTKQRERAKVTKSIASRHKQRKRQHNENDALGKTAS